jgi:hypothetical protein
LIKSRAVGASLDRGDHKRLCSELKGLDTLEKVSETQFLKQVSETKVSGVSLTKSKTFVLETSLPD